MYQILENGDTGGTSGADNNIDSKNAHINAGFNTYNNTDANTFVDAGDTSGMRNCRGTCDADNKYKTVNLSLS